MQKNFDDLSMQEAMRLANTDTGRQLIAMFKDQHSDQVQTVMDSMRSGDVERAKQALAAFMADPRTQALLAKMEETNGRNRR
jgi:DNA-binding GntR family transcriptional regulator